MSLSLETIRDLARQRQPALVAFAQDIIQIPSPPGHEGNVAVAIHAEMEQLGYDRVWIDEAGNVIGQIKGGPGPAVLLNGHIDHVDPGPVQGWPYPPFSGQIVNGELWGRGSVDMKGPLACMIYAGSLFKLIDVTPPGDIYVTAVVMEEIGGLGTQYLATQLRADAAICGEPGRNILRRGHRGRVEVRVTFKGRSAHASAPHLGVNPHYAAATFLSKLSDLPMTQNDTLGPATVAPTRYLTDQTSANVIPGEIQLTLDWRNVPAESPEMIVAKVNTLLKECGLQSTLKDAAAEVATIDFTTYTGLVRNMPMIFPSFLLAQDDPLVYTAQATLVQTLGRNESVDVWQFATDGGHLMAAGIPTIGFGPGDERLAHTNQERIRLAQMEEAVVGYVALILALGEQKRKE